MRRPKRAHEAGGIYHALNRGNARSTIFHKPEDFDAIERILLEGLEHYLCKILSYQLMHNHWLFVLQPTADGGMSRFLGWVKLTHTMRLHSQYQTAGEGHVYQGRFKSFPIQVLSKTIYCVGEQPRINTNRHGFGGASVSARADDVEYLSLQFPCGFVLFACGEINYAMHSIHITLVLTGGSPTKKFLTPGSPGE